jgi:dephospho-CoA kinase
LTEAVNELLKDNPIVLIEGLRGTAERDVFVESWNDKFLVVAVTASKVLRFERVQSRARSEDGDLSDLEKRDAREAGWGLDVIISEADITFPNESNLHELESSVTAWLNTL